MDKILSLFGEYDTDISTYVKSSVRNIMAKDMAKGFLNEAYCIIPNNDKTWMGKLHCSFSESVHDKDVYIMLSKKLSDIVVSSYTDMNRIILLSLIKDVSEYSVSIYAPNTAHECVIFLTIYTSLHYG